MRTLATLIGLVIAAAVALPDSSVRAAPAAPLDGYWIDSDGEVILEVGPCGPARCAHVAWLKQPLGSDGKPLLDFKNPDPGRRVNPVCGMRVISGFTARPDGTWGGGTVYVPDHGISVAGSAEVLGPTKIKVNGYIALPIFGSSEVWTRVVAPAPRCPAHG